MTNVRGKQGKRSRRPMTPHTPAGVAVSRGEKPSGGWAPDMDSSEAYCVGSELCYTDSNRHGESESSCTAMFSTDDRVRHNVGRDRTRFSPALARFLPCLAHRFSLLVPCSRERFPRPMVGARGMRARASREERASRRQFRSASSDLRRAPRCLCLYRRPATQRM
jgi:hypothetical protein